MNYTERETVRACVCACVCLYLDRKRKCHMGGARGVVLVWTNNEKPPCSKSPTRERAQNDTISRPRSSATLASAHDEHVNIRASAGISCRIMIAQKRWINMQNNKMPRPNRLSACAFAFRERKKAYATLYMVSYCVCLSRRCRTRFFRVHSRRCLFVHCLRCIPMELMGGEWVIRKSGDPAARDFGLFGSNWSLPTLKGC